MPVHSYDSGRKRLGAHQASFAHGLVRLRQALKAQDGEMTSKRAVRLAYAPDGGSRSQLRLQSPQLSPAAWGGFAPGGTTVDLRPGGVDPIVASTDGSATPLYVDSRRRRYIKCAK